jgi:hypothetical protein
MQDVCDFYDPIGFYCLEKKSDKDGTWCIYAFGALSIWLMEVLRKEIRWIM